MALTGTIQPINSFSLQRKTRCRPKTVFAASAATLIALCSTVLVATASADHKYSDDIQVSRPLASTAVNRINKRQHRQRKRIERGIHKGDLTRREARELNHQQEKIAHARYKFEDDGYLSPRERKKLMRMLDRAGDRIYRFRHNNRFARHGYSNYDDRHAYGSDDGHRYGHRPGHRYGHGHSYRHGSRGTRFSFGVHHDLPRLPRPPKIHLNFGHHGHSTHTRHRHHNGHRFGYGDRRSKHWKHRRRDN